MHQLLKLHAVSLGVLVEPGAWKTLSQGGVSRAPGPPRLEKSKISNLCHADFPCKPQCMCIA